MSFFKDSTFPVIPPAAILEECQGKLLEIKFHLILQINLRKSDGRLYGCRVSDTNNGNDTPSFESVMLVVEGRCDFFVVISCYPIL